MDMVCKILKREYTTGMICVILFLILIVVIIKMLAEIRTVDSHQEIRPDALKSNDGGRTYIIQQNVIVNDTLWDITVEEKTAFEPVQTVAYYLIKGETVFLFNEHGVFQNYAMTITLTPWTIEDIERMDGIEITSHIK